MADDYIIMRHNVGQQPETIAIANSVRKMSAKCPQVCGQNSDTTRTEIGRWVQLVVGMLHQVWSWADQQTTVADGGFLPKVDLEWVDGLVNCQGFGQAMVDVGWLQIDRKGLLIPNFGDWMGKGAKRRARDAKRKRAERENVRKKADKRPQSVRKKVDKTRTTVQDSTGTETDTVVKEPPYPPTLDTTEFHAAWDEYVAYRRESKFRKLQDASVAKQLKELATYGHDRAIESIQTTIRQGWQGLFEPGTSDNGKRKSPGKKSARDRERGRGEFEEPYRPLPRL
ncbi:MAG: hypothetical protein ACE5EQ_08795 [Phycisphaerae bacterium]